MAIIETISPIIAVGMTYELHSTPFAVRLFQVDDSKDACSRYHKAEDVPAIAFVSRGGDFTEHDHPETVLREKQHRQTTPL